MSRKKLEHALYRAVEDLPRPGLDAVSGPPVVRMEVHDYITRPASPDPRLRRRRLASLAAAVCLLAVIAGAAVWTQFFQIYSTVELSVNPHFSIRLNRRDQVRAVDGVNGDAQALLEGRSYRGWTLEATVNSLMDELALKGYLTSPQDQVDVLAASKALPHVVGIPDVVGHTQGLPPGENGGAGVAPLLRRVPVLQVAGGVDVGLTGLHLGLLQAQRVAVRGGEKVEKSLFDAGAQAVDVPGNQFHACSSSDSTSPSSRLPSAPVIRTCRTRLCRPAPCARTCT